MQYRKFSPCVYHTGWHCNGNNKTIYCAALLSCSGIPLKLPRPQHVQLLKKESELQTVAMTSPSGQLSLQFAWISTLLLSATKELRNFPGSREGACCFHLSLIIPSHSAHTVILSYTCFTCYFCILLVKQLKTKIYFQSFDSLISS